MYIRRNTHQKVSDHIVKPEYTIITGARQTGKTSLIRQLFDEFKQTNETSFFLTFENREILSAINEHPENLFRYAIRPKDPFSGSSVGKPVLIFIDEIQYADDPSNFLKYLYDTFQGNLKIVATGSSAFYLDSNFDDSLAGRKRLFTLRTLSFDEYLRFKNLENLGKELSFLRQQSDYISAAKIELLEHFNEYLVFGGYPKVCLEPDSNEKVELLKDLKNSFLKRDIDEAGVDNPESFYQLFTLLSAQVGNLLNKNELSNTLKIDNKTVDRYISILQKSFHISLIRPFSTNLRKELTKMPKVFFHDLGMRNVMINRFFDFNQREDRGQMLENYVFNRLSELYDPDDLRFWRTQDKKEMDFVITTSFGQGLAFEVKMDCPLKLPGSVAAFQENYPTYAFEMLTYNFENGCRQVLKI